MSQPAALLKRAFLVNALNWFQPQFRQDLLNPIEGHFPNFTLPQEIQAILRGTDHILQIINGWREERISAAQVVEKLSNDDPDRSPLFKQIVFRYRRCRAAYTESLSEKTFHVELTNTVEEEVKALDNLVSEEWFQKIEGLRLPRLKDFLPVQFIEAAKGDLVPFQSRQYDEKFHILQAPHLFLPDLAHFRAKCEDRDVPRAVAFLDIDDFKKFNSGHTETTVDRNLLPRFMQTIEAHVFHHGYAYRQGGDEYLILIPGLSERLSIDLLDELRCKLADLTYSDIKGNTTVTIGLCIVGSDCPLTDRELRDRANQAKKFAKDKGKNRIATYAGPRFVPQELQVVRPTAP